MNSYVLEHIKKTIFNHSATFLATLFSMSVVLSCLSFILLARQNLVAMADRWGQDNEITTYLEEDFSEKEASGIMDKISSFEGVENVVYVSKSEAAARFLKRMGHLSPNFIQSDNEKDNPLPVTLDIKVKSDLSMSDRASLIQDIAQKITVLSGVSEVSFGQGWLDGWSKFLEKFNIITLGAIVFVLLLGLLIIGNATRVSMERRIEEIEVLELVGATTSWIRRPFLVEGALLGVFSAALSLIFSNFFNRGLLSYFSDKGLLMVSEATMDLSFSSSVIILLLGFGFGLLGSFICVRNINTGWASGEVESFE